METNSPEGIPVELRERTPVIRVTKVKATKTYHILVSTDNEAAALDAVGRFLGGEHVKSVSVIHVDRHIEAYQVVEIPK